MTDLQKTNPIRRRMTRRGNTMILVAGILVLLVIIATAYITRTQGGRVTAGAIQAAETRDNNADLVADMIADEIAAALFAWPVDPGETMWLPNLADANAPRFRPGPNALRYGVDPRDLLDNATGLPVAGGDGYPDFAYNVPPYHTAPFTNWPDQGPFTTSNSWPRGPGAPNSALTDAYEGNPVGQPGTGDTRWLRDTEPLRWDTNPFLGSPPDYMEDLFKYWRHMTCLARANNGFRIVFDISDVLDANGDLYGGLVTELNWPVEQWLAVGDYQPHANQFNVSTGNASYDNDFMLRWYNWFRDYPNTYNLGLLGLGVPTNFYHLNDLNGDGNRFQTGERPSDEFLGPGSYDAQGTFYANGTWRWNVSRVLADTDGDGFTDAFWHLAPTPIERGIRQIVAVSIVDNSGLLNGNVATRFSPGHLSNDSWAYATAGETPADLAAVGQQRAPSGTVAERLWNVGFLDALTGLEPFINYSVAGNYEYLYDDGPDYPIEMAWTSDRWPYFLNAIGVQPHGSFNNNYDPLGPFGNSEFRRSIERRWYWLWSGSRPFNADWGLTPFTLSDEVELRASHGQNSPWILSRFENALNDYYNQDANIVRSSIYREESSPYLNQLSNRELLFDTRRKLTLFSGARNDEMPPWLRWRWDWYPKAIEDAAIADPSDLNGNGRPDVYDRFLAQSLLKLDLREAHWSTFILDSGESYLHERLPWTLLLALTDGDHLSGRSYLGSYNGSLDDINEIRKLAASISANLIAYRDFDNAAPLKDDITTPQVEIGPIPLPRWGNPASNGWEQDLTVGFLGMEPQPFLMEAFIGHVYDTFVIPGDQNGPGLGYLNSGTRLILDTDDSGESLQTTVTVVQIANPFDEEIVLWSDLGANPDDFYYEYEIELFGQTPIKLSAIAEALAAAAKPTPLTRFVLPPARDDWPATMIIYSIDNDIKQNWKMFLDIEPIDHPIVDDGIQNDAILVDLRDPVLGAAVPDPWDTSRAEYDSAGDEEAILLNRIYYEPGVLQGTAVTIDRIEPTPDTGGIGVESFRDTVVRFGNPPSNKPPTHADLNAPPPMPPGLQVMYPTLGWEPTNQEQTHWIQWARITRAWGNDFGGTEIGRSDPSERNPRYINGATAITWSGTLVTMDPRREFQPPIGDPPMPPSDDYRVFPYPIVQGTGMSFSAGADPDAEPLDDNMPWFTMDYIPAHPGEKGWARKPFFFNFHHENDWEVVANNNTEAWSYPDKGFYHSPFALQMLQKNGDFQQVGELTNIWMWCHELKFDVVGVPPNHTVSYNETTKTFSEYVQEAYADGPANNKYVNRLRYGEVIGGPSVPSSNPNYALDPQHAVPDMPAGLRALDAFVCDGPGWSYQPSEPIDDYRFGNALGFTGRMTPGLINLNTAPVEVLQTLPHWYKLVHAGAAEWFPGAFEHHWHPRSAIARGLVSYREHFSSNQLGNEFGIVNGPDYRNRSSISGSADGLSDGLGGLRQERGLVSPSEIRLVMKPAQVSIQGGVLGYDFSLDSQAWRANFAAGDAPFNMNPAQAGPVGAYLSTDVIGTNPDPFFDNNNEFWPPLPDPDALPIGDFVARDAEEANMLYAGASNLVTTRSDVFTVYFRVRSFKQNPMTGVWNATDPEYIVDDSRYVMLVDRSEVNSPEDKPKILYLEKLPN